MFPLVENLEERFSFNPIKVCYSKPKHFLTVVVAELRQCKLLTQFQMQSQQKLGKAEIEQSGRLQSITKSSFVYVPIEISYLVSEAPPAPLAAPCLGK